MLVTGVPDGAALSDNRPPAAAKVNKDLRIVQAILSITPAPAKKLKADGRFGYFSKVAYFCDMLKGIFCFDTGEFKRYRTENQFPTHPLLEFMKQAMGIDYCYRHIVTRQELEYYMRVIGDTRFRNQFEVIWFSFHGTPENICLTQDGKRLLSLEDLAEMAAAYESFKDRHIHFSSCETLNCDDEVIRRFKRNVGAKTVSGYVNEVDSTVAFINELAYFHQISEYSTVSTIKKHMEDYQAQLAKLGFKIV